MSVEFYTAKTSRRSFSFFFSLSMVPFRNVNQVIGKGTRGFLGFRVTERFYDVRAETKWTRRYRLKISLSFFHVKKEIERRQRLRNNVTNVDWNTEIGRNGCLR